MTTCPSCGKELTPDAAFCIHCGARVWEPPFVRRMRERDWDRDRWRERGPRDGWWGAVSAFGFLIILGLTLSQYPDTFALLAGYFESWGTHGYPVLPGRALGQVLIYLLTAGGIWGLISAGLRFAYTDSFSRPIRGIVGGLFSLYMANAFSQFYSGAIRGSELVLTLFVGLAVVIVANAVIAYYLPHRLAKKP